MATLLRPVDPAEIARDELERRIQQVQRKSLLRFITCGSVDDGKSTLIGRLLYDSRLLLDDQLSALESDSRKFGTQGDSLDFALLVDGLSAEREQGITIDVAYRFFSTQSRKFIVADTPGHEQYTRNMVTGASTADVAVILVDARKGILTQTKRHAFLVHLIGIRHIVLAVNKMDLVGYDEAVFEKIVSDFSSLAAQLNIGHFTAIPLSGLVGDNVTSRSPNMPWYEGSALLEHLENADCSHRNRSNAPFRMAVQWVSRPNESFRGFAGRIASGHLRVGDEVAVLPSGRRSVVERIVTSGGDLERASEGQSVTLTLRDEIDCSRGDLIVSENAASEAVSRIQSTLVWMSEEKLVPNRSYWLKVGTQTVSAKVDVISSILDVNSLAERAGEPLGLNDIGKVEIDLARAIPPVRYEENRKLGGFILIDKFSHSTIAAGLIEDFPQPRGRRARESADDRISWIAGPRREEWAAIAAQRQRAQGHKVVVLDDVAISRFGAPNLVRTARSAARLLASAGVEVLVTLEVNPDEAHPGRRIDSETQGQGGEEWVI